MACSTALSCNFPRRRKRISSLIHTCGCSAARSPEQITSSASSFCLFFPRMITMSVAVHAPRAISSNSIGPSPMELLLMALGACTATDIVIILGKKRQKLEALEVICSGERAAEQPQVWIKLDILFRLRGKLQESAVLHAIQLSEEKYCSVSATLKKSAALTWRHEI